MNVCKMNDNCNRNTIVLNEKWYLKVLISMLIYIQFNKKINNLTKGKI